MCEALARAYIINTPGWFVRIFSAIAVWLPRKTQSKIKFCRGASEYEPLLRRALDDASLASVRRLIEANKTQRTGFYEVPS